MQTSQRLAILATLLALGCTSSGSFERASTPPPSEPASLPPAQPLLTPTGSGADYVFIWLRAGDPSGLSEEEVQAASAGHFANMERLFEERFLLVAGPLGEPRSDPAHRGIFIFDVDDVNKAHALTRTDPAVANGVFRFEAQPLHTQAPLRHLYDLEKKNAQGPEGMRSYVLALSAHPDEADEALSPLMEEGLVAFSARLGTQAETGLYVLETESLAEARDMLSVVGAGELGWRFSPWYGSKTVAQLAGSR